MIKFTLFTDQNQNRIFTTSHELVDNFSFLKITLVGNLRVGKYYIVSIHTNNVFPTNHMSTM